MSTMIQATAESPVLRYFTAFRHASNVKIFSRGECWFNNCTNIPFSNR